MKTTLREGTLLAGNESQIMPHSACDSKIADALISKLIKIVVRTFHQGLLAGKGFVNLLDVLRAVFFVRLLECCQLDTCFFDTIDVFA